MQVTGKDIISEILRNMRVGLEPLHYTTLAPAIYQVRLQREDFERLSGVLPTIAEEAKKALCEQVTRLNKPPFYRAVIQNLFRLRARTAPIEPAGQWQIDFQVDADDDSITSDIVVNSELALPPATQYGVGAKTKKVSTSWTSDVQTATKKYEDAPTPGVVYGTLRYADDSGDHTYVIDKDTVVIGRGGSTHAVDLKLNTAPDVSRRHICLRRDPVSGRFYLKNISSLGTTIDGKQVPTYIESTTDGSGFSGSAEVLLPDNARIGLAEVLFLDFKAKRET